MENKDLFNQLLTAESETDVARILEDIGYMNDDPGTWKPLGGDENSRNWSTIGNQMTNATAALVEKIINGVDAVLTLECQRTRIDPESPQAPQSMSEAVEKFLSIKEGRLENLTSEQRRTLADRIQLIATGTKEAPCYLVIDKGEGQTPKMFPKTFLSLNKGNKDKVHFVQGRFNCGGTGVLPFCGKQNFQLIVSKRNPDAFKTKDDATNDLWGFTLVRRMFPEAGRKGSSYVYLAPAGEVLSFAAKGIKVLPGESRKNQPAPAYSEELTSGTCVKLYNYMWRAKSILTTDGRYELERLLHAPCLPVRLTETREGYRANYYSTTLTGIAVAIASDEDKGENKKIEKGFPAYGTINLPEIGRLPYEIVVFQEEVDKKHVPTGVFFTLNGQVHGRLSSDFVTRKLKFDFLRNHLLVTVGATSMEKRVLEDLFPPSRDRMRENEVYFALVKALEEDLKEHAGLRALNAARRQKDIEQAISGENEALDFFQDLLSTDPTLAALLGGGGRLVSKAGPGAVVPFVGKKFPTFFRLSKEPKTGLIKTCPINRTCRLEFETDVVNDYFERADSHGSVITHPADLIEKSHLWDGVFTAKVRVPWDAKIGDRILVKVEVSDVQHENGTAFTPTFTIQVTEAQESPEPTPTTKKGGGGGEPPPRGQGTGPSLALPKIIEVPKEKWLENGRKFNEFTALEVRNDGEEGFIFYVNTDNTYLLTELVRANEPNKPLVKFWFKYGMALCAMGMLQEQKKAEVAKTGNGAREGDEEGEDKAAGVDFINKSCTGIARVIIPIIRRLYRGPQTGV